MIRGFWRGVRRARQRAARIGVRLLASALLLVLVPIGGVLYLGAYERHLLEAQERSMVQQGRLLAAALAESAGSSDADRSPGAGETTASDLRTRAAALLAQLDGRVEARLRIVDRTGVTLADSSALGDEPVESAPNPYGRPSAGESRVSSDVRSARDRLLYRLGLVVVTLKRLVWPRAALPESAALPAESAAMAAGSLATLPEVQAALAGRYGAATRLSGNQRSVTLSSAIPIRRASPRAATSGASGEVIGAVLVSQSTHRLLAALYDVRLQAFQVVLFNSLVVAIALSIFLTASIAHPLRTLSREASALMARKRGLAPPAPAFAASARHDEVGDLARVLETVIARFDAHIQFVESFTADVAHELKNPIAAMRTVAEMLATVDDQDERARVVAMLARDVERLDRLVSGLREVVHVDAQLDREPTMPVDIGALLANIAEARRLEQAAGAVHVVVAGAAAPPPLCVRASPDRLAQVFGNLVENAVSFSPSGGTVTLAWRQDDAGGVVVRVEDEGKGIPEAHLTRVFERFFTYRPADGSTGPASSGGRHTGLGLAIAKAIVDGYGGAIVAGNRDGAAGSGARFDVWLPLDRSSD